MVDGSGTVINFPGNRDFKKIINKIRSSEDVSFPKVSKNSCGYRIDKVSLEKDLHKAIAGSEGTLGIIVSAKLRTYPLPKNICLCIIHYGTLTEAVR
ncbi:FAD-binding oxidoreductase, partial [Nitrosococcus oceani]|uniref:FAD-binding oxidoreductase n=1 Tax=Nitrosococcus oceani TaxID=1229 RepID=UPI001E31B68F